MFGLRSGQAGVFTGLAIAMLTASSFSTANSGRQFLLIGGASALTLSIMDEFEVSDLGARELRRIQLARDKFISDVATNLEDALGKPRVPFTRFLEEN